MVADVWEPWTPQIGQRVRVRSRPECYYCREYGEEEAGLAGTVFAIRPPCEPNDEQRGRAEPGAYAHRFWVKLDVQVDGCNFAHFAAIELEPVNAEPDGDEPRDS